MKNTRKVMRKFIKNMKRQNIYVTNAKLYDIAYELKDEDIELFNDFCSIQWGLFKEYLEELNVEVVFIGRTSSFYLIPAGSKNCLNVYDGYFNESIKCGDISFSPYDWYSDYVGGDLYSDIQDEKSDKEIFKNNNEYYLDREVKYFKESMKNVKKAYVCLENFKENQLEIWYQELEANYEFIEEGVN